VTVSACWAAAFSGLAACSHQGRPQKGQPQKGPAFVEPGASVPAEPTSLALWLFEPKLPPGPSFRIPLAQGGWLAFDELGVRSELDASGRLRGVPMGAPERLVGARKLGEQFVALGLSGRVYVADEALLPWSLASAPDEPFVSAALGGSDIAPLFLGVRENGELYLSRDLGRHWSAWASDRFFYDVYADDHGGLLLQSLPEAWFRFTPETGLEELGVTFGGSRRSRRTPEGVVFEGRASNFRWDGHALQRLLSSPPEGPASPAPARLSRFARASDLGKLGSLDGATGQVFLLVPDGPKAMQAFYGALAEPLVRLPIELNGPCSPERVAVSNQELWVLCADSKRALDPTFSLYASFDGGRAFLPVFSSQRGEGPALRVAAGPSGQAALYGLCSIADADRGCEAHGLWTVAQAPQKAPASGLEQVPIPELEAPLDFAFAGDGALFAVYQHGDDNHLWLYRVAPLRRSGQGSALNAEVRALDLSRRFRLEPAPAVRARLFPGSGPAMGLSLETGERRKVLALDAELNVWGFGDVPSTASDVGGAGLRVLALDSRSGEVWESQSAGLDFAPQALPLGIEPGQTESPAVACSERGCLLGADLIRSGWGGTQDFEPRADRRTGESPSQSLAPIQCRRRARPSEAVLGLASIPTAHDAARGNVAWSQVAVDPVRAQVSVFQARYGEEYPERLELLPPSLEPDRVALFTSEQVEGSAALRYRLPGTGGAFIDQVEVAWDNRMEDTLRRETLTLPQLSPEQRAQLFATRLNDYEFSSSGAAEAKPWLLSVSGKVVYLGWHGRPETKDDVIVAGDQAGGRLLSVPASLAQALSARTPVEVVNLAGEDAFFVMDEASRLLRFPSPLGGLTDFRLAPEPGRRHLLSSATIAYRGSVPQFSTLIAQNEGDFFRSYQLSIADARSGRTGASTRVPVLSDVGDRLRACTLNERRSTHRGIVPAFPEDARAIEVELSPGIRKKMSLVRAVVQGTITNPCVATLEAEDAGETRSASPRALIDLRQGAVSWLFEAPRSGDPGPLVGAMDCALGSSSLTPEKNASTPRD
jgi:hypothetical protein